jgi:hypothetical protein
VVVPDNAVVSVLGVSIARAANTSATIAGASIAGAAITGATLQDAATEVVAIFTLHKNLFEHYFA